MELLGSCHCQAIKFKLLSKTPYPYIHCYCSICRKTDGGTGAAINIMGEANTFRVLQGAERLKIYHAKEEGSQTEKVGNLRHFCDTCGCHLWAWDPEWPENIYPLASAIDTKLPAPPQREHVLLDCRAPWVAVPHGPDDHRRTEYPPQSIEEWHKSLDLYDRPALQTEQEGKKRKTPA